jgi:hypothetical protein
MTKYTVTMALMEEGQDGEWTYSTDHAWHTFYEGVDINKARETFDRLTGSNPQRSNDGPATE